MDKAEVERLVAERLRTALERAAAQAVQELNDAGHGFTPATGSVLEWVDPRSELHLEIGCALGVSLGPACRAPPSPDPALEAYLERALSGEDRVAEVLNAVESEVANGGFLQLYENRGPEFMAEAVHPLRQVGASQTADLLERAIALLSGREDVLLAYAQLQGELDALDERFNNLPDESLPALFTRYRAAR